MIDEEENLHRQGDVVSERENENLVSYKNLFKRFFFFLCLFSYSFYSLTGFCLNVFLFFSLQEFRVLRSGVIYWLMMLRIMKCRFEFKRGIFSTILKWQMSV